MPFGIRGRLAFVCAAVLFGVLGVYVLVARALDSAQLAQRHADKENADVLSLAATTAASIQAAYDASPLSLTTPPPPRTGRPPAPLPPLRAILDTVASFVWVLDTSGFTIYSSSWVRGLSDADRGVLDSLVASTAIAARVEHTGANSEITVTRVPNVDVRSVSIRGRQFLLYSVLIGLPQSVHRIVAGNFATPPPEQTTDFGFPFLLLAPIVLIVGIAGAGLFGRMALQPTDDRIDQLISNVEAISDGRSLHRRVGVDEGAGEHLLRLTETLNAMIGRLEKSFGGLRRFTADASHELKTPLTVLRADVERAMSTRVHSAEQMVALEEALAETTRMADLVESLLTLARADEGRFDLYREPVDLEALARDVFETAVLLGEPTGISVRMSPPASVTVPGDRARLRQLFLNLVTNAIKYTPPRGDVELSLSVSDGFAHFAVRDSGIGIAAADIEHVFERFWRADRARSRVGERGGFGLGLAISNYIAQAHGGSLKVQSRLGRGSTFTVALPVHLTAESPAEK